MKTMTEQMSDNMNNLLKDNEKLFDQLAQLEEKEKSQRSITIF